MSIPFLLLLFFCLEMLAWKHYFLAVIRFLVFHMRRQISQLITVKDLIALALNGPSFVISFYHRSMVSMIICTEDSFLCLTVLSIIQVCLF